ARCRRRRSGGARPRTRAGSWRRSPGTGRCWSAAVVPRALAVRRSPAGGSVWRNVGPSADRAIRRSGRRADATPPPCRWRRDLKTASASASPTRRSRAGWRNVRRSAGYMRWSDPRRRTRSPCQGSGPESRDLAELDRAVLAPGTPRGFGDAERLERVCRRARIVRLAARETEEVRELGVIGVTEPDEKGRICRTAERQRVGFHRADRRSWIQSDGDRVLGAVDLDTDVVSGLVMT